MSAIGSPRVSTAFTAGWLAFVSTNAVLMYLLPGEETIPYHLIWASFAFIYGVVSWPGWATWTAFGVIPSSAATSATGPAPLAEKTR